MIMFSSNKKGRREKRRKGFSFLFLFSSFFFSACAPKETVYQPIAVDMPVTAACKTPDIPEPDWPLHNVARDSSLVTKTQAALAELDMRKAYEARITAALASCGAEK